MDISSITKRQPLNPDDVLYLNDEKCIINSIRGTGTSSIVYEATLGGRKIILKELYPQGLGIFRDKDSSLLIPKGKENEFQSYKDGLKKAYKTQLNFHNDHKVRNFTAEPQKLYKHNNTLYVVMHLSNGNSYDQIDSENVLSILEVGKALSKVISYYHEKGFLNLDIKSGNIFVFPETNQLIQLFDFNTVCTKEEALQGRFSYSEGYAAPEVKAAKKGGGKLSEVREQADIYSIGAVIFEKIMGRVPKAADQRAGKRWKFENNPYLKDVVPQLQKGITELFRKTLAIDKKDRYSSAKELISNLENLIKLANIKVFLKNQRISPYTPKDIYISRKNVLSEIAKRLDEKYVIYLHALGGSGKSETAREYAEQCAGKYDFIQSVFYSGSLKKTIANLDFVGLKDQDKFAHTDEDIDRLYNYKCGLLGNTSVYGTNTLLIIDNYDYNADPTSEEYQQNYKIIRELKKLNIHILFTTRVRPEDGTECLDLENMSEEELKALFFRINPKDKDKPERMELVKEIIEVSYNHTMTVKLVAMQSAKYLKPLSKYLDILKTSGLNSGIKGRVTNEKDDESITMSTVYAHIKALFDFNKLNQKQKYIMVNTCLLPLSGLEVSMFSEYIDLEHFDGASDSDCLDESIEDLVNSGWIEYADKSERRFTAETKITLHPLICDIVTNELKPELTEDKCRKFYISFLDLIQEWGNEIFNNFSVEVSDKENTVYLLFPTLNKLYIENNIHIAEVINEIKFSYKSKDIKQHISDYTLFEYHKYPHKNKVCQFYGITEKYIVPDDITEIGSKSFMNSIYLSEVIIHKRMYTIEDSAFENCRSLKVVTILNDQYYQGLSKIENKAFKDCISLKEIMIPFSVKELGSSVFSGCSSIKIIEFSDLKYSRMKIGPMAFMNCNSLEMIKLPNSLKKIDSLTFSGCISLKEINIPYSVEDIEYNAFENCTALITINMSQKLSEKFNLVLTRVQKIQNLLTLDTAKKIINNDTETLENIQNLFSTDIELGKDVLNAVRLFEHRSLKNYIIPENAEKIEDFSFLNCKYLKEIKIPYGVETIGKYAFANCESLQKIFIPSSVEIIEICAFLNCGSILEVDISYNTVKSGDLTINSLKKIGRGAFANCTSLNTVKLPVFLDIEQYAFINCKSLKKLIIPENADIDICEYAFQECISLNEVIIPKHTHVIKVSVKSPSSFSPNSERV